MHGCKRSGLRIAYENWNTVSRFHREQNLCRIADKRIAVLVVAEHARLWLRFLVVVNDANVGAVHLPATGQDPVAFEELEKAAAVLVNVLGFVFVKAGKIKRVMGHLTDAAQSG